MGRHAGRVSWRVVADTAPWAQGGARKAHRVRPCGAQGCAPVGHKGAPLRGTRVRPCGAQGCAPAGHKGAPLWGTRAND
jgi:hypothetical protein